jgi:hypothetical protein
MKEIEKTARRREKGNRKKLTSLHFHLQLVCSVTLLSLHSTTIRQLKDRPTVANDRFSNVQIVLISIPTPSFHLPHSLSKSLLEMFLALLIFPVTMLGIQRLFPQNMKGYNRQ